MTSPLGLLEGDDRDRHEKCGGDQRQPSIAAPSRGDGTSARIRSSRGRGKRISFWLASRNRPHDGGGRGSRRDRGVLAFNSDPPARIEANQLLEVILGAERRFVGPLAMDDLNAVVERIADELRATGRKP